MSLLDTLAGATAVEPQPIVLPVKVQVSTCGLEVIPYNGCGDPMADSFLPWAWQRMQQDDLVDLYFPGQKQTGFATFVRMLSGDANVAIFKTTDESMGRTWDDRIPGFITWSPIPMGAANVISAGFIFFRKWWDHHTTDDAAREAFKFWFTMKPPVDIVLGFCPSRHAAAMRYNKRVGLHEIGRIPGAHLFNSEPCDAVEFAMTRKEWEDRCQQQPYHS